MKAEIKNFAMVGGEFSSYWPDDVTDFCFGADVTVGPEGCAGGDIFSFEVCTTRWLSHSGRQKPCFMRHIVLMDEYDEECLKSKVRNSVENTTGETWREIAEKLASGLIETKESVFGFPSAQECATIFYAHRDHI